MTEAFASGTASLRVSHNVNRSPTAITAQSSIAKRLELVRQVNEQVLYSEAPRARPYI